MKKKVSRVKKAQIKMHNLTSAFYTRGALGARNNSYEG